VCGLKKTFETLAYLSASSLEEQIGSLEDKTEELEGKASAFFFFFLSSISTAEAETKLLDQKKTFLDNEEYHLQSFNE